MNSTVDELAAQAERLSDEERDILLDRLLLLISSTADPEIEQAWIEEAERRCDAIDRGEMNTVPWEEVRKDLGRA